MLGNQENALHTNISAADNYVFKTKAQFPILPVGMKVKLIASVCLFVFKVIKQRVLYIKSSGGQQIISAF